MPARTFTTYRSAGPVLPEFLSNLKNLFKVAYIYPYDVSAARTQNSKDFFTVKVILLKPWAANRRLFNRKFQIVRIGQFWRIQRGLTQNICEIV